jgi:peptidoglycan/LPS O-acetylase OafA/YrhL
MTSIFDNKTKVNNRISSIDMLRGIAALMVCIYHITNGNRNYLPEGYWLKRIGSYGWAGVEIFFVISGFVIPWSLYVGNYTYKGWRHFLLKRITRIDPPYLVTIILILFLNYVSTLSPYFKGQQDLSTNYYSLALHLGYLNAFFNQPWLNPVFWTLAIEFQFYLLLALCFPLFVHPSNKIKIISIIVFFLSGFILNNSNLIFYYSSYFIIGILIFYRNVYASKKIILDIFCFIILGVIYVKSGPIACFASFFAWGVIVYFKNLKNKWVIFLGTISYSLYLIHVPIGGRMINFSMNFIKKPDFRALFIVIVTLAVILASYIFYKLVELPAINLSKRISSKKTKSLINTASHV